MAVSTQPRLPDLLQAVGLDPTRQNEVTLTGHDPIHPVRYPVAEASATVLAAIGVAANDLWELRTGRRQQVAVDARHAAASIVGHHYLRLNGQPVPRRETKDLNFSTLYQTKDGRWVHTHGGTPWLAAGTAKLLGCGYEKEEIAAAVAKWDSQDLEDALAEVRVCGGIARTPAEWRATEQGALITKLPPVEVVKIADGEPVPLDPIGDQPLAGIKALDLTHILAGPVSGRTLAQHGAEVLHIAPPHREGVLGNVLTTNAGKLSAHLDLNQEADREQLWKLIDQADVFTQGYRAGALDRRGFNREALFERRPGLIYLSVNCYGPVGPWVERPGYEQLGQTVSGLAIGHGGFDHPVVMPVTPCDYTTGYFAALGVLIALGRRAREGGSYHVRASLAQTGTWIERWGNGVDPEQASGLGDVSDLYVESESTIGRLSSIRPPVQLSETPARWARPAVPLGTHPPEWPE